MFNPLLDCFIYLTAIPTKEEFPSTTFVRSTSRSLLVGLHWNCSRIKGEFRFRAELICNSEWCINETQTVVEDIIEAKESPSIEMPVYGYTNYTLRMFMDRKGVIFPKDEVIITKASGKMLLYLYILSNLYFSYSYVEIWKYVSVKLCKLLSLFECVSS